jgi:glycosyltransferase involved in cell wall biosynthesis
MIWLASYPRSGNTLMRNILYEVYGLSSGEFHREEGHYLEEDYFSHPFVKTHLLPLQLEPSDSSIRAVYIVRDGRDALVSMARQRQDIVSPGSDFRENLMAAIFAEKGTFFGGWSGNAETWARRADIIIRYEDLIADPIGQAERLRSIMVLPEPDRTKIPDFGTLKSGRATYGARKNWGYTEEQSRELADKAFRKGKAGSWKEEMPDDLHDIFWTYHGETMLRLGYTREGTIVAPDHELDHQFYHKLGYRPAEKTERRYRVLIEAAKLDTHDNDGVKRYISTFVNGLSPVAFNPLSIWQFDLMIGKEIISLAEYAAKATNNFEKPSQPQKAIVQKNKDIFERLESLLLGMIPEGWVKWLKRNNIYLFHQSYDLLKKFILTLLYWLKAFILFLPRLIFTLYIRYRQDMEIRTTSKKIAAYDLIHVPLQQHFRPFKYTGVPLVFTIHDFTHKLFPGYHTRINRQNAGQGLRLIEKKNAHVISVSASTLSDARKFLKLPADHHHLVYESVEENRFLFQVNSSDRMKVREKYGIRSDMPFILLLSTIEPRKNLHHSIQAFQLMHKKHEGLSLALVVAGKQGWKVKKFVGYSSLIHFTGFVEDADLPALYSEALALSYVSFYEGFGLPILEAMRCGTPVIYGNNSSMPEVAGEGGLAADAYDPEDICEKYETIYFDSSLREELGRKAFRQSLNFSTHRSTLELLDVYKNIIEGKN